MARAQHIDAVLKNWPYEPGDVSVRLVAGGDGREVLQMRVDLGLLQLEVDHRPDGARPGGAETYFDYLLSLAIHEGDDFQLTPEQCAEVDREFVQYYQRRICWLALREFDRAVRDANHSLALMDFVKNCSPDEDWTRSHEQYRPFILFHRTQAAALAALEDSSPEKAIEELNSGIESMRQAWQAGDPETPFEEDEMVERLNQLRESLRDHYNVGRTLNEQLAEAVATEQYELAARLRDEIAKRGGD
ncbi:MAG TPA: UvrB/UvrC motif-containing protein [Pirellulales bacterium]|nr:UvrB/UvrC motif-containing protein [Pirellulales bacterium]